MLSQEYITDRKVQLQNTQVNSLADNPRFSKIKNALQCIEDGSYGYCESCNKEIEKQRLNYLPETPLCLACAKLKR